jgi:hypothetical protein
MVVNGELERKRSLPKQGTNLVFSGEAEENHDIPWDIWFPGRDSSRVLPGYKPKPTCLQATDCPDLLIVISAVGGALTAATCFLLLP